MLGGDEGPPAELRMDYLWYTIDADRAEKDLFFVIRYKVYYHGHKQDYGWWSYCYIKNETTLYHSMAKMVQSHWLFFSFYVW